MGSALSSDSITIDQLHGVLDDLKTRDAKVAISISAFHYEEYTVRRVENELIPPNVEASQGARPTQENHLRWVRGSNGTLPEDAFKAGLDHGVPIFVARVRHQGDLVPGKLHPGYKTVFVPWGGGEHAKKTNYEVLTGGANLVWKQAADGHVPKNAVQGGETSSGQPLFVIRAKVEGSDAMGKVNPNNKFGRVPYGGQEHIVKNYEVLVQRNNKQSLRPAPSSQPRVHTEVRQRKVETFRTEHKLPISTCFDLTGLTLQGWQPSAEEPVVKVSLNLEVFPMDKDTSDRLEQYKRHFVSEYASKDKIVETNVIFSVNGHKTLIAGKGSVTITAYDPRFEDEARSGWCCFNRPGVKKAKITVIKKFQVDPLHISCGQRSLTGRSPPPQLSTELPNPHQQVFTPPPPAAGPQAFAVAGNPQYPPPAQYQPPTQYFQQETHYQKASALNPPESSHFPTPGNANPIWVQSPPSYSQY